MIKISQLYIQNVGPFEGETFDFSVKEGYPDIHIFTGPNGCGKTTILHGLASEFNDLPNNLPPVPFHGHQQYTGNLLHKRYVFFEDIKSPKSLIYTSLYENEVNISETILYGCQECKGLHSTVTPDALDNEKLKKIRKNGLGKTGHRRYDRSIQIYNAALNAPALNGQTFKFAAFGYSGYRLIESANISKINENENFNPLHLALEFVKKHDEDNRQITDWIVSRYSKAAIEETHGNKELAEKYRAALNCLMDSISDLTNGEFAFKIKTNPWKIVLTYHDKEIEFDALPDGLRSVLSWMGDLLMRLDAIPWEDSNIPVNHQNIILFLDEIEVHLHPKWQCQILPLTQKIFPNAQIFLTTHSPFIINSIDNAKIYKLKLENGVSKLDETLLSQTGESYNYVYEHILETTNRFAVDTEKKIAEFDKIDAEIVKGNFKNEEKFKILVEELVDEGEEVITMISSKLHRLKRVIGKDYLNGKN